MSQPSVIMALKTNTFVVAFEFGRYVLEKYYVIIHMVKLFSYT